MEELKPRGQRMEDIADELLSKVEQAMGQLDICVVNNKRKTKEVEYDAEGKKVVYEVVEEENLPKRLEGVIDRQGLKTLTAALKDLYNLGDTTPEDSGSLEALMEGLRDG